MRLLIVPHFLFAALGVAASAADSQPPAKVKFNRDIRPLMSDTCFHCHGFDAKSREAGLRLDLREQALKKTDNDIIPIVPGKPEESEIITRIFSQDKDEIMPPPKAHKEFTAAQKKLFRRWVAEGAEYEAHWAYAPLVRPAVPVLDGDGEKERRSDGEKNAAGVSPSSAANPIDAFIREKLEERKITPSPEAPKAKLLRRLSLDLTGLPPTPEEVAAFVRESEEERAKERQREGETKRIPPSLPPSISPSSASAYERAVDRLLASPRYGERMAVWWLDVARFTDTVGFHGDQNQRIFPYRDYVIGAFNANKRFDQFTIEQLAGDLLPNPTTEQLVATGYNRLNMMTREGGAQPKEYLAKYGAERVRAVSATWFGSTFGCAECHDHKFDPIKTADFYSLQAFFADVKQWGVYSDYGYTKNPELAGWSNEHPFPPEIEVESPYLRTQMQRAEAELRTHFSAVRELLAKDAKAAAEIERWTAETRAFLDENPGGWMTPPVSAQIFKDGKPQPDADVAIGRGLAVQFEKALGKSEELRIAVRPGAGRVAALRMEAVQEKRDEADLHAGNQRTGLKLAASVRSADGKEREAGIYFAEANAKEPRYESGEEVVGVRSGWKLPAKKTEGTPASVWLLDPPLQLDATDKLVVKISGDTAVPLRVSTSPLAARDPLDIAPEPLREAVREQIEQRTAEQRESIAEAWLLSTAADGAAFQKYKQLAATAREFRGGRAWTMVSQAVEPLTVRVLPRGNWQDESGAVVLPSTPSFLPGRLESSAEKRLTRLDLARWLVSKENPITARAVTNRLWQQFFGTGLSAALDDLGSQGELPSHPELLDWVASEFRDSGWNVKHMIKLIVTSATYRQSSSLRPELRDLDPANRLLASQNPRRLEAEFVRDNALFVAGALNLHDIGGPSVKPYQPEGYYEALQFPDREYVASAGAEQWRRGVYMHWQRTFLHPMLANFDAPGRDECAALRVVSNTPQQALTLLNDPSFVEAARLFATRLLKTGASDDERIDRAFQLAVARGAKDKEKSSLKAFLSTQREYFRANAADAEKLLKVGYAPPSESDDKPELAAWTSLCRVVLNSQEAITRY